MWTGGREFSGFGIFIFGDLSHAARNLHMLNLHNILNCIISIVIVYSKHWVQLLFFVVVSIDFFCFAHWSERTASVSFVVSKIVLGKYLNPFMPECFSFKFFCFCYTFWHGSEKLCKNLKTQCHTISWCWDTTFFVNCLKNYDIFC